MAAVIGRPELRAVEPIPGLLVGELIKTRVPVIGDKLPESYRVVYTCTFRAALWVEEVSGWIDLDDRLSRVQIENPPRESEVEATDYKPVTPTSNIPQGNIGILQKWYKFRGQEGEAANYIKDHSYLEDLLLDALVPIKSYFPDSTLSLEVFHDPETVSGNHLVIYIGTTLTAKEALRELDKIDEGWWADNIERALGKLSIDLEFL